MLHCIQLKTNIRTVAEDSPILPKTCTVLVTVAVLCFLPFLASTTARAQAPAGPNLPPGVPDGYVITPSGYFHPSCVRLLAEGEALLADGPVIRHTDGTTESIPACAYPRYTASGEIMSGPLAIVHSYIEYASATTSASYGGLTATWTVPPAPTSNDNQTVYFFPALDDIDDTVTILQPVLAWNDPISPGAWSIASWNCCVPPTSTNWHSPPVSVSPGDEIKGTIWNTCGAGTVSCPTWNVISEDVSTGLSTPLKGTPSEGQTFNWAFAGALEVYNVGQCSDYPPNGALTFSDVALYDYNFDRISNPGWSIINWAKGLGLTPQCGYGGQVAATQVTLDYSSFITLASFNGTDGESPGAGLVQATNGDLYGTTFFGGASGAGAVFKITPSGTLTTLYSFCSQSACTDGQYTYAGLVQAANGDLYGTTPFGGASGAGTVFRITLGGTLTTLYSFCSQSGCADGYEPIAGLVQAANGELYGTTYFGGASGAGTVFKITPSGTLTTLYSSFSDGQNFAGLVQAANGDLYGTTYSGGAHGGGTVFKITPSGTLTTLYNFCSQSGCTDGEYSRAGLVQATNGDLYGTTANGGAHGYGTVFKITPSGTLTTLYSFCSQSGCADGALTIAGLIQATNGDLYGTTWDSGTSDDGTVFSLSVGLGPFVETLPTSGKVGAAVKILGTNLTGATSVSFNGTGAVFEVVSSSEITTTVPTGATTGTVQVVTPNGTLSSNVPFRVP